MWNRKYLWIGISLVLWLGLFQVLIPHWEGIGRLYGYWIFRPFQAWRGAILQSIAFSLGDVVYIIFLLGIPLWVMLSWRMLIKKDRKKRFFRGLATGFWFAMTVALFFFIGWGGNYYKPELRDFWNIPTQSQTDPETGFAFYGFLGKTLNYYAPKVASRPARDLEKESKLLYAQHTDLPWPHQSLGAKPSLFGSLLPYLGIQGYYNPFTGEAQWNANMPTSLVPFVISHEMAHQAGIAAEGDANFLAYLICRSSDSPEFHYSACLHLWMYTYHQLMTVDSTRTRKGREALHPIVKADLDEIRAYQLTYKGRLQRLSSKFYDYFLKWNRQPEGIRSYRLAGADVWAWENLPDSVKTMPIALP